MRLIHNSRVREYRTPFGAVPVNTVVHLALRVEDASCETLELKLRVWSDRAGERFLSMTHQEGTDRFVVSFPCQTPELLWYSFYAKAPTGECAYLGAQPGREGGAGKMYEHPEPPSFQLTVYQPRSIRPSWYEQGIVYQIFPDRYRRDESWEQRVHKALSQPRCGIPKRLVEEWETTPSYERNDDGSIKSWDFYAGSLRGIEEDLDRLAALGVSVLYLNPIFEASSNHRYDTGNYLEIDPVLGSNQDFCSLCNKAKQRGISIILDGVFNHTGDDSRYFNRYGNYPELGAWQSEHSPWREAYRFHEDGSYDAWWGIGNMPALNPHSTCVCELLLGEEGVIRSWLRSGARGWRLDVADELDEELIRNITRATLEEKPDGLVLGEVWEDASNKVSYGALRHYLLGDELDAAMNYPFRDMVIAFILGDMSASDAVELIETLAENYPLEALRCSLNLLGSHDRPRITSLLGGADMAGTGQLSDSQRDLALVRFWLALVFQMTFPGVPCLYYGDEYGLEGMSDPYNRATLPTGGSRCDMRFYALVERALTLRRADELFQTGEIFGFVPTGASDDVLAFTRSVPAGTRTLCVIINRSETPYTLSLPVFGRYVQDLLSHEEFALEDTSTFECSVPALHPAVLAFDAHVSPSTTSFQCKEQSERK